MKALVLVGLLAGCYQEYGPGPVAPMGNIQPEPVAVAGPPGGEADPGYSYDQPTAQDPDMPGYPAGYPEGYPAGSEAQTPSDPYAGGGGGAMDPITDAQMDATLSAHGEWLYNEDYGRVWRPHATVVGASFTPYETCGSWIWTDYGWTYSCDWDWGWMPFHYGQWDWFDGGWCWVPGYTWGPGWVDWRYGGGYVGWRPSRPNRDVVRDHRRDRTYRPVASVPARPRESVWRFIPENTLGHRVRGNLVSTSTGLSATAEVLRPPVRGSTTVAASSLLDRNGRGAAAWNTPSRGRTYPRTFDNRVYPQGMQRPYDRGTWRPSRSRPAGTYDPSRGTFQPSRGGYNPPSRGVYDRGQYNPSRGQYNPSRGQYNPSRGQYNPPSRGSYNPSRGSAPPSRGSSYSPPSRGSSSYSRPSSSSSPSYSRPSSSGSSRSSGSSSGSSRGSSSGGSRGRR